MTKLITRKTAIASIISLIVASSAYADVPNTFVAGQPASAAAVNENFSNLDGRVTALETADPATVAVNCGANADALKNLTITKDTTYNISGACTGPIFVDEDNVHLLGSDNTADSIVLPSGLNDESVVFAGGANNLQITNLFLDLTTTTANNTAGISARNSFVRVLDSRIEGGTWGINPFRSAIVRLDGVNSITGFSESGLSASDQSNINTRGQTTVNSNQPDVVGVIARRGSSIDVRGGITVSVLADERAVRTDSNSTVTIRDSGTVSLTGEIRNGPNSSIQINGGTINGELDLRRSSNFLMFDGVTITGDARLQDGAIWDMDGGSIAGNIEVRPSARLRMEDVAISGEIRVDGGSWTMEGGSISGIIRVDVGGIVQLGGVTQTSDDPQAVDLTLNSTLQAFGSNLGHLFVTSNSTAAIEGGSTIKSAEIHNASHVILRGISSSGHVAVFAPASMQITDGSNLNGNNVYACNTPSFIDFNSVTGIANASSASFDCRP